MTEQTFEQRMANANALAAAQRDIQVANERKELVDKVDALTAMVEELLALQKKTKKE